LAVVNDLVTNFSFTGSTAPLSNFTGQLNQGIGLIFGFDKGLIGISESLSDFVRGIVGSIDPLVQIQRETGVAVSKMQELGFVASQNGSSIQDVTSTIESLSGKIADASINGSEDFAKLGVNIFGVGGELKSADKVLEDVGKRFKQLGLSMQQQKTLASSLGISGGLIQTLNLTDEKLSSLTMKARELGVVSKADADSLAELNNSFEAMNFGVDSLKRSLAIGLAPAMKDTSDMLLSFLAANKDLITDGLLRMYEVGKVLAPVVIAIGVASYATAIGMAAMAAGVAFAIDEVITAMRGGDSVIGSFFSSLSEGFSNLGKIAKVVITVLLTPLRALMTTFNSIIRVAGMVAGGSGIMDAIKTIGSEVFQSEKNNFTGNGTLGSATGFGNYFESSLASKNAGNSSNISQDVVVNINAANAEEAKRGVMKALDLQKQMESAKFQSSRGQ